MLHSSRFILQQRIPENNREMLSPEAERRGRGHKGRKRQKDRMTAAIRRTFVIGGEAVLILHFYLFIFIAAFGGTIRYLLACGSGRFEVCWFRHENFSYR